MGQAVFPLALPRPAWGRSSLTYASRRILDAGRTCAGCAGAKPPPPRILLPGPTVLSWGGEPNCPRSMPSALGLTPSPRSRRHADEVRGPEPNDGATRRPEPKACMRWRGGGFAPPTGLSRATVRPLARPRARCAFNTTLLLEPGSLLDAAPSVLWFIEVLAVGASWPGVSSWPTAQRRGFPRPSVSPRRVRLQSLWHSHDSQPG